jgi:hypothetical protein
MRLVAALGFKQAILSPIHANKYHPRTMQETLLETLLVTLLAQEISQAIERILGIMEEVMAELYFILVPENMFGFSLMDI